MVVKQQSELTQTMKKQVYLFLINWENCAEYTEK